MEPIVFGDAEVALLALLRAALPQVPGPMFGPSLPPKFKAGAGTFVRIERIGGYGDGISHDLARLDIDIYGHDRGEAHDLMQLALAHILAAPRNRAVYGGQVIYRTEIESGIQFPPDTLTSEPRCFATVGIRVRPARATQ